MTKESQVRKEKPASREQTQALSAFALELIEEVKQAPVHYLNRAELEKLKKRLLKTHKLGFIPTNADLLFALPGELREEFRPHLLKKPTRTRSGVAPVAVMTSPKDCPHGKCIYCPGGVEHGSPQSYTGEEPAALRAKNHDFDPYHQVQARLTQYQRTGHETDKVDLIIMGGTFPAREEAYQKDFVKGCLNAMNRFGRETRTKNASELRQAQLRNGKAPARCIGLTVETRPDWCKKEHIDGMLSLGATRVELGVQSLRDEVLKQVDRGHGVGETIKATRLAKDAGLKICYHMMPGLPGSGYQESLEDLLQIFSDERFMPDMLKIYPTLVMEGTKLHQFYRKSNYQPLDSQEAARLIAQAKALVPPWVRIQRIQRDIPAPLIDQGVKRSDLRMLAWEKMKEMGTKCSCIRCREVGLNLKGELAQKEIQFKLRSYPASRGLELFLSYETGPRPEHPQGLLIAYCRLRIPSEEAHRPELREKNAAIIRELKVFGEIEKLGQREAGRFQHRGLGRRLLAEAERLAFSEHGRGRLLVTSGVGVRNYYRSLGYRKLGPYMAKKAETGITDTT